MPERPGERSKALRLWEVRMHGTFFYICLTAWAGLTHRMVRGQLALASALLHLYALASAQVLDPGQLLTVDGANPRRTEALEPYG